MKRKTVSIVISAYNEQDCIDELVLRLQKVFLSENKYAFEIIIVENGSEDGTWEKLKIAHKIDSRFKVIRLSRNFRMDGGLTAGLDFISGDACVLMAADLQDPPEFIPNLLRKWEEGWENIYAVIGKRAGTGPIRKLNSQIFYWLANKLTDGRLPRNASDFRLVDKKVYLSVKAMKERNRFVRGLFAWSGYKSIGIKMDRLPRYAGKSNAQTLKVIDLAIKGIFAHSVKPLRFITLIGLILSSLAFSSLIVFSYIWFTRGVPFAGFGSIVGIFVLANSILLVMIGIIGEYIGLIYEEVKQRPNFLISETLGY